MHPNLAIHFSPVKITGYILLVSLRPRPLGPQRNSQGRHRDDTRSPRWRTSTLHHRQEGCYSSTRNIGNETSTIDDKTVPSLISGTVSRNQPGLTCRTILANDCEPPEDRVIRYQNMEKVCKTILTNYLHVHLNQQKQYFQQPSSCRQCHNICKILSPPQ